MYIRKDKVRICDICRHKDKVVQGRVVLVQCGFWELKGGLQPLIQTEGKGIGVTIDLCEEHARSFAESLRKRVESLIEGAE